MATLKIETSTVKAATASRGFSEEEYVSRLASISAGYRPCACVVAARGGAEMGKEGQGRAVTGAERDQGKEGL